MHTRLITPSPAEPVALAALKDHLNITATATDDDLALKLAAARRHIESKIRRRLVEHVFDGYMDAWPRRDYIELPFPPLVAVSGVYYTDSVDVENTWATTEYGVDLVRGRVTLKYGKSWPSATLATVNPIRVRFRCGWLKPFTADATANTIMACAVEGLANGDVIRLSNSGGALPSGLAAGTDYYVVSAGASTVQVSLTAGGAAVDLEDTGSGTHFVGELPEEIRIALMMRAGAMVENRESEMVAAGSMLVSLPIEDDLLAPYADLVVPD